MSGALAIVAGPAPADAPVQAGEVEVDIGPRFVTIGSTDRVSFRDGAEEWTPERIANARPLEVTDDGSLRVAPRAATDPGPIPLSSDVVTDPARFPNRVHGKILGTFPGIGDFSCSASVASSASGSLLTTAGHCIYDAEAKLSPPPRWSSSPDMRGSACPTGSGR